jgi:hypothetical protein
MTAGNRSTVVDALSTRCPTCGRCAVANGVCSACGFTAPVNRDEIIPVGPATLGNPENFQVSLNTSQPARAIGTVGRVTQPRIDLLEDPLALFRGSEISGRVIILRQAPQEPMDIDPWRWVAIPTWGLLLLLTPVAGSIVAWQSFGLPTALGVAVISLLVLRYLFSDRLLQSWHLTAALNGHHIVEPMPVLMVRLRQWDEREVQMRLKGSLAGGTLMEGDRIRAAGRWRSGVFRVRNVFCERTGAEITPRQPTAFRLAMAGVGLLLVACLWLQIWGVPWVVERFEGFRHSIPERISLPPTVEFPP